MILCEGNLLYAKDKDEKIKCLDMNLVTSLSKKRRVERVFMNQDPKFTPLWEPVILESNPQTCQTFEEDPITCRLATFVSSQKLFIFSGSTNSHFLNFEGSHFFLHRYLAFNVLEDTAHDTQSDFNSTLVALDGLRNQLVTWGLGTGKVLSRKEILPSEDSDIAYKGHKSHSLWDQYTMIYKSVPG